MVTAFASFVLPVIACLIFKAPMHLERLPLMFLLLAYYLAFSHTISFCIACFAFFLNRAQSFTMMKNMVLWVLAGELIPLDLYPEPLKSWLIHSPFAAGVYVPVAFITGRIGPALVLQSFVSITLGLVAAGGIGYVLWWRGVRSYTGTGA
jgi:ABC-2 type transport system permease protein